MTIFAYLGEKSGKPCEHLEVMPWDSNGNPTVGILITDGYLLLTDYDLMLDRHSRAITVTEDSAINLEFVL